MVTIHVDRADCSRADSRTTLLRVPYTGDLPLLTAHQLESRLRRQTERSMGDEIRLTVGISPSDITIAVSGSTRHVDYWTAHRRLAIAVADLTADLQQLALWQREALLRRFSAR